MRETAPKQIWINYKFDKYIEEIRKLMYRYRTQWKWKYRNRQLQSKLKEECVQSWYFENIYQGSKVCIFSTSHILTITVGEVSRLLNNYHKENWRWIQWQQNNHGVWKYISINNQSLKGSRVSLFPWTYGFGLRWFACPEEISWPGQVD